MSYILSNLEKIRNEIIASGETVTANKLVEMTNNGIRNIKAPAGNSFDSTLSSKSLRATEGESAAQNQDKGCEVLAVDEMTMFVLYNDWYVGSSNYGTRLQKILLNPVTGELTLSSSLILHVSSSSSSERALFALSPTKFVVIYNNYYMRVFDKNLNISSEITIPNTGGGAFYRGCNLTESRGIIYGFDDRYNSSKMVAIGFDVTNLTVEFSEVLVFMTNGVYNPSERYIGTSDRLNDTDIVISFNFNTSDLIYVKVLRYDGILVNGSGSNTVVAGGTISAGRPSVNKISNNKILASYIDANSSRLRHGVLYINNMTITYNVSSYEFSDTQRLIGFRVKCIEDNKCVVAIALNYGPDYGYMRFINIDGDTVTATSKYTYKTDWGGAYETSLDKIPNKNLIAVVAVRFATEYYKSLHIVRMASSPITSLPIGVSKETKSIGSVKVSCGDIIKLLGLSQGMYYYISDTGYLVTTPESTPEKVGLALSSNELLWLV